MFFTSKALPLIIEEEIEETILSHEMIWPIEKEFSFSIKGVQFIRGSWFCNKPSKQDVGLLRLPCPLPGTYPYVDIAGGIELIKGVSTTDLYWEDNKLYCYFEGKDRNSWEDYYPNNRGVCTYRIFGESNYYKFSDQQGIIYEKRLDKKLTYQVECDACCKDTEILCSHHHYPGYKCYPIPPTASRLLKGQNEIARYWRHHK